MITIDFKGKLALVTGGGRGIGAAISTALAEAGADVAITYTSQPSSAETHSSNLSQTYDVKVKPFKCDVTDSLQIDAMVLAVEKEWDGKKVDYLICNAGIALWKDAHEVTDAELQLMFATNTFGPYYTSRSIVRSWLNLPLAPNGPSNSNSNPTSADPHSTSSASNANAFDITTRSGTLEGKQILFVSSISGIVAMTPQAQAVYNGSKAGLTMLSKSLAQEWAHLGIRVNSISPGYVLTDMIANPPDEKAKTWVEDWQRRTPTGKFAKPEAIGEFVALLLSERAGHGFMAGSDIVIDGGYTTL